MKIFFGGRASRGEFHELERDVRTLCDRAKIEVVARSEINIDEENDRFVGETLDSQEPSLRSLYDVDLFLLCRSFPNEFCKAELEMLRRVNPLAPIVLVAGSLCAGEERTGEAFDGVKRFYIDGWRANGRAEFERFILSEGAEGLFAQPALATPADIMMNAKPREEGTTPEKHGAAVLLTVDSGMRTMLKDLFQNAGYEVFTENINELDFETEWPEVERVVVDVVDLSDPEFPEILTTIKRAYPGAEILLLAYAPRPHEREFYERRELWGRVRVVGKPFDVDDIVGYKF